MQASAPHSKPQASTRLCCKQGRRDAHKQSHKPHVCGLHMRAHRRVGALVGVHWCGLVCACACVRVRACTLPHACMCVCSSPHLPFTILTISIKREPLPFFSGSVSSAPSPLLLLPGLVPAAASGAAPPRHLRARVRKAGCASCMTSAELQSRIQCLENTCTSSQVYVVLCYV